MSLTQIRGDQIQSTTLSDSHMMTKSDPRANGGIKYDKLNLGNSLIATDLSSDKSVHQAVLDSHYIALWDAALNQAVTGTSINATSIITAAAATDTATMAGNQKGVLTTGTGVNGAGTSNYRVQIRNSATKDTVFDGLNGIVYGELTNDSVGSGIGNYTLSFKKSDGSNFTMATKEVVQITTIASRAVENDPTGTPTPTYTQSLNGKYFTLSNPANNFYVWYNVTGSSVADPYALNPGATGIPVIVPANADATTVATLTAAAINVVSGFTAVSAINVITVTCSAAGSVQQSGDGIGGKESGFTISTLTVGSPAIIDFMFSEVYTYLTAPYSSFITGMGFADVVGVSGTHNHNDLYYTKIELEQGQLNDLYYTQAVLDGGQLDNRYSTKAALDPNPGTDSGVGTLDDRYFRKSQLTSVVANSSGAGLIGVTPTGNLTSNTVQTALVQIQGEVDGIISGALDIQFSMDKTYDDGSVVAVDATNVDFQLAATKQFKISEGGADVLNVTGVVGTSTITLNANTTANGTLNQNGAATIVGATSISGGTASISATALTLAGTQASVLETTGANLDVKTITSGNLALTSAGSLTVKDSNLAAALPVSQTGVTALSPHFATAASIVGAINETENGLYTLINTTLPSTTSGSSGASDIGVTGIPSVIPTGGSLGSAATVQHMLEGIALSAGGGKTFPTIGTGVDGTQTGNTQNPGSLLSEKANGMYFKPNELVFVRDINRFVTVKTAGTAVVSGVDYEILWDAAAPLDGAEFKVISSLVTVATPGAFNVSAASISMTEASGASIVATSAGKVDITATNGQAVGLHSDTEVKVVGGALVDISATAITTQGKFTATGNANDNISLVSSGTGTIEATSSLKIDLNAPTVYSNGNLVVLPSKQLYVDQINITSVDPSDQATITGTRTGEINTVNLLQNSGFEDGQGTTANHWTITDGVRSVSDKYYDIASAYVSGSLTAETIVLQQNMPTLVANSTFVVSVYAKGTNIDAVKVKFGSSASSVVLIPAGANPATWTRYTVLLPTAGNATVDTFQVLYEGQAGGSAVALYLDAIMLEVKAATPASNYFGAGYQSELILNIGNNDNDRIVMRSTGTSVRDLLRINQNDVEILGNLIVSGTRTEITTQTVNVSNNEIVLNDNVSGAPTLDAFYKVSRGTLPATSIKWNEAMDRWELTNDGTNYYSIVTASGSGSISLETAYTGGSAVAVTTSDVTWALSASRKFLISDGTDANKFSVTAGSNTDSVNVITAGGVHVATNAGVVIGDNSGASLTLAATGSAIVRSTTQIAGLVGKSVSVLSSTGDTVVTATSSANNGAISLIALSGGVSIATQASKPFAVTAGSFGINSVLASNITVTGADLTLATATSGSVKLSAAAALTFSDSIQSAPIVFSQTNANGFVSQFDYSSQTIFDWTVRSTGTTPITSIMGAINANRSDLYEYVELLATQGAAVGIAAGANLIGVKGISGVIPTGGSLGSDANLQNVLEGIALSAGGGKTFANIAAFTTAKSTGIYFKLNEDVYIIDVNREVRVLAQGVATAEGTDWTWIGGTETAGVTSQAIAGAAYKFNLSGTSATSFNVQTTGGITLASAGLAINSSAASLIKTTGAALTLQTATSGDINLTSVGNVNVSALTTGITGTALTATLTGAATINAAATSTYNVSGGNLVLKTTTSGDVNVVSAANVNIGGATIAVTPTTLFSVNGLAYTLNGTAASTIKTTGANLNIQTVTSGEIEFKDARMASQVPLTDAANAALVYNVADGVPASIFDAINRAYNNIGDSSKNAYYEAVVTNTNVSNAFVQVSGVGHDGLKVVGGLTYDLPGGATNLSLSPAALRNTYGAHVKVYLNGLRLGDTEWVYVYDQVSGQKVISFDGDYSSKTGTETANAPYAWLVNGVNVRPTDTVALVATDKLMVEVTYNQTLSA